MKEKAIQIGFAIKKKMNRRTRKRIESTGQAVFDPCGLNERMRAGAIDSHYPVAWNASATALPSKWSYSRRFKAIGNLTLRVNRTESLPSSGQHRSQCRALRCVGTQPYARGLGATEMHAFLIGSIALLDTASAEGKKLKTIVHASRAPQVARERSHSAMPQITAKRNGITSRLLSGDTVPIVYSSTAQVGRALKNTSRPLPFSNGGHERSALATTEPEWKWGPACGVRAPSYSRVATQKVIESDSA